MGSPDLTKISRYANSLWRAYFSRSQWKGHLAECDAQVARNPDVRFQDIGLDYTRNGILYWFWTGEPNGALD